MIKLTIYLISIIFSFSLLSDTDIKTQTTTEPLAPCTVEDIATLENFNFLEQGFLFDFDFEAEESTNQRCWGGGGPGDSCYVGGCPNTSDYFCDGVCETVDGCTVCWICSYSRTPYDQ